ncbi:MAG TPA: lytic transglycosylase domain-containing protein [Gammaproteobacteria bacterium]|nr:lytic transglycosylase domain-containing protein [Gammaproteobacteria bacterium]
MPSHTPQTSRYLPAACLAGLLLLAPQVRSATLERPDAEMRQVLIEAINSSDSFIDRFDAEVWLTDMSNRLAPLIEDPQERLHLLKQVHYEARRASLDPELVLALITVESNFDRFAISTAGAQGMMQIMPFWLDEIGHPEDNLFDIATNLRFGCTILSIYLKRERGNLHKALARYNGSVGKHWYPQRVFRALRKTWYHQ